MLDVSRAIYSLDGFHRSLAQTNLYKRPFVGCTSDRTEYIENGYIAYLMTLQLACHL